MHSLLRSPVQAQDRVLLPLSGVRNLSPRLGQRQHNGQQQAHVFHGAAVLVLAELSVLYLEKETHMKASRPAQMKTMFPAKRTRTYHRFAAHFAEGTGTFGLGARLDVLVELKAERTIKVGKMKKHAFLGCIEL